MATPTPLNNNAFLEPILQRKEWAKQVQARSGLIIPPPDNKHSFEGIPNQGIILALPRDYEGALKVGMRVHFTEKSPKGFRYEGKTYLPIKIDDITAEILV